MLLQGKRGNLCFDDIKKLADLMSINEKRLEQIVDELKDALLTWPVHATKSGLDTGLSNVVETSIQTQLGSLRQI